MGNDLNSSNNDLLKRLQSTVMNDDWLSGIYSKKRADQQSELKKIFTVIADNNVTASQKRVLETRREQLQDKVEKLEAKMAVLEEELAKNQEEINKNADEITNLVCSVEDKSQALAEHQKKFVKDAIEDVFYEYGKGLIGKDAIAPEIKRRIQDNGYKIAEAAQIEKLIGKLEDKKGQLDGLITNATKWLDQKNLLEAQYGATKSTYDLLGSNLKQIGATETNYTNSDFDTNIPVYSLEKTDIVSDIFESPANNVQSTNTNYKEGSTAPKGLDELKTKYQNYFSTKATDGVDAFSTGNDAVKKLGQAIDNGLLDDLKQSNATSKQIADFMVQNFGSAQIQYNENGKLNIPYGHGDDARKIFDKVTSFFNGYNQNFKGALNTWDENAGNTISSNKQIEALANNYEAILDKMGRQEPKFTFKEAMYALFDRDKGLFKNSGVVFNAKDQGEKPNYFIEFAGDDATADMYKKLSDEIYDIWGVRPNQGADYEQYDKTSDTTAPQVNKTDPITFNLGKDNEYALIIDRNDDGAFTDSSDFVGGMEGRSWLDDLKSLDTNKDGKLSGDELKELKLLGSDYTDNAQTTMKDGYLREETTNIQYTLTNAKDLGIEEIDLTNLQAGQSLGKTDINGSELFKDSFTFKLNGEDVTASRKDDTEEFMKAVYGDAYGKNFRIGLNDKQVEDVMRKDYGEFDTFASKYGDIFQNLNIIKNAGQAGQSARALYNDTMDIIQKDENAQLAQAGNKAAALTNNTGWETGMSQKVQQLAAQQGVVVDMEQAKGIYVINAGLDAQGIIDEYLNMVSVEDSIENDKNANKNAWDAVVLCLKEGIQTNADEILELLKSGKAKTPEEVVEILKQARGVDTNLNVQEIGFDNQRQEEIYNAFNEVFNAAGLNDKVVDALAQLCTEQQNNFSYMNERPAKDIAEEMLKKYQQQ